MPVKLGDGAGNGFGLLRHQKVSRARQVDNPDTLAELLAERVAIARRSHFIVDPPRSRERRLFRRPTEFLGARLDLTFRSAPERSALELRPGAWRHSPA